MRASALVGLIAGGGCHHARPVEPIASATEGLSIAVYDKGDGSSSAVIDDRRVIELKPNQHAIVLSDIEPSAALPSLLIESSSAALHLGACHRDILDGKERGASSPVGVTAGPVVYAPIVTCLADGAPGRYLVRVLYVTQGLNYRAAHEVRISAPDRIQLSSRYILATPAWNRSAELTVFDGAPGGEHVPRPIAKNPVTLDGSLAIIASPERELKARLRRIFDGAMPVASDIAASDIAWGESSHEQVWVWLELADTRIPPGAVHAVIDLPNELARVADLAIENRRWDRETPDAPTRLPLYVDDELHGQRQRWHDFADSAELADRFLMSVRNTGDEPREVWIEEHLRPAKRRSVVRAVPKKPGLHGEILRAKVMVKPSSIERVSFTVDYDF